jgi:hypothetical protein
MKIIACRWDIHVIKKSDLLLLLRASCDELRAGTVPAGCNYVLFMLQYASAILVRTIES